MSHSQKITRAEPTLLFFVIDQSGSMCEPIAGASVTKAQYVADVINRTVYQLAVKATRDASGCRHYFDIGAIGYGSSTGSAWLGALQPQIIHSLPSLASRPPRTETKLKREPDGAGGIIELETEFPVWIDPVHSGGTPMAEALQLASREIASWIESHPRSFPPTVVHITDGQHTTADPEAVAELLRSLRTEDGEVLLFNIHIDRNEGHSIVFPSDPATLPDAFARRLYTMSSMPPEPLATRIDANFGPRDRETTRLFGYRCDAIDFVRLLDIGTPDASDGDR
jgi:hypothetical protein